MKHAVKITQTVVDRLKASPLKKVGSLYGSIQDTSLYIVGIYTDEIENNGDLYFPADIDMCGVFQIGDLNKPEIDALLKQVDVTDNPIILSIPEPNLILAYYLKNDQFVTVSINILPDSAIYKDFMYVRLKAQVPFTAELDTDAIKEEMLQIRKQFSSGKIAFKLQNRDVLLLGSNEHVCGSKDISANTNLNDLYKASEISEDNYSRNEKLELQILPVIMYKKASYKENENEVVHAPIIQMQKCDTTTLHLLLSVDSLALVHKSTTLSHLYTTLVECACRNIRLIGQFIVEYFKKREDTILNKKLKPEVLHFYPNSCSHFISRVVNRMDKDEDENEVSARDQLHSKFLLPKTIPLFKSFNRYTFDKQANMNSNILINPHATVRPTDNGGDLALVQGNYRYYHYCQDKEDDDGWGCAYRSLQTLASWFKLQGYTNREVPDFKEIQKCLYDIGDKPSNFVGSKQWIGSTEVNFVLDTLFGIQCKILYVSSGEEMSSKGPELEYHFKTNGTPVMIGGGVLAHTILGVDYNKNTGDLKFLILDPHYTGSDELKPIITKGWCGWKGTNFWDKKAYYNMCLPIIPKGI